MSDIYITEPITKGKVVLKTTVGEIDVELWAKECPKACRNFVQLCMEGYYDNNIFHRVVKGFIAQTGDPTGTGFGGESIYGEPFADEFHSRIRFSHRGIVAMATSGPGTNQSQFFITLDKCPELAGQHTIFGKVTGASLFNVLKMNDLEVDENERPLYPPEILSVDVVWNPFDDIVPIEKPKNVEQEIVTSQKEKVKKNLSLLSFGDVAEEEEQEEPTVTVKMKSAAAFSNDPKTKQAVEDVEKQKQEKRERKKDSNKEEDSESKKRKMKEAVMDAASGKRDDDQNEQEFDKKMRQKIVAKRQKLEETEQDEQTEVPKNESGGDTKFKAIIEEQERLKREIMNMKKREHEKKEKKA